MDLPARVAKLESLAEKTGAQIAQVDLHLARIEAKQDEFTRHYATKADVVALRDEMKTAVSEAKSSLSDRIERDFRILFGALIAVALGLAGLMAKGFHWLS